MNLPIAASLNPKPLGIAPTVETLGLASIPASAWARQERSNWCWAAVSAMIDRVVPPAQSQSQCKIGNIYRTHLPAGNAAATVDWCDPERTEANITAPIAAVLAYIGTVNQSGIQHYGRKTTLVWAEIFDWVRQDHRFCPIRIMFSDGSGGQVAHYIAATGVQNDKLVIYDPAEDMEGSHRVELTEPGLRQYRSGSFSLVLFV